MSKVVVLRDPTDSDWGYQYSDVSSGMPIALLRESLSRKLTFDDVAILRGGIPAKTQSVCLADTVTGEFSVALTNKNLSFLLCMAMGFEDPDDSPVNLGGGYYKHIIEIDSHLHRQAWLANDERDPNGWTPDDRKVRSFAFAISKDVCDHVTDCTMINSMSINVGLRESSATFGTVGYTMRHGDFDSSNWTSLPHVSHYVFHQATFYICDHAATGSPRTETAVAISEFRLTLENNLKVDDQSTDSGVNIVEPMRNATYKVTGSITLPRYTDDDILDLFRGDKGCFSRFVFENGSYSLGFYLPLIKFTEEDISTSGMELRRPQFSFEAFTPVDLEKNPFEIEGEWLGELSGVSLIKDGSLVAIVVDDSSTSWLV